MLTSLVAIAFEGSAVAPVISIIVPVYRAESTVATAIASLLDQTEERWEAILAVDDGGDYLAVLAAAGIRDSRLKQVSTGNIGSGDGAARNAALPLIEGELVGNLDADDTYESTRLAELVPLARVHGAAVCNTGVYRPDGTLMKRPFPDAEAPFALTPAHILEPRVPFCPVFQRAYLGSGWTSVAFAADVLLNLELLCRAPEMVAHPEALYKYVKQPGSITQSDHAYETAERGYHQILSLLETGALDLTDEVRSSAIEQFRFDLALNDVFRRFMEAGRCQNLEEFLEITDNGRAPWLAVELGQS